MSTIADISPATVAMIMGSTSDYQVMKEAEEFLQGIDISVTTAVVSAHRTPERMFDFARSARAAGFSVIIAGAGGAAHLPGMVASLTTLPVIGVPILSSNSLQGMDSLLSIVQMPGGIPVATVAVNGAKNAGILAARIISLQDPKVESALERYRTELAAAALESKRI